MYFISSVLPFFQTIRLWRIVWAGLLAVALWSLLAAPVWAASSEETAKGEDSAMSYWESLPLEGTSAAAPQEKLQNQETRKNDPSVELVRPAVFVRLQSPLTAEKVTLGDLFEGLDSKTARMEILTAPAAGEKTVLSKEQLWDIARRYHLPWQPEPEDQVVLERLSFTFHKEEFRKIIAGSLPSHGYTGEAAVEIFGSPELSVPLDRQGDLVLTEFRFDAQSGLFSARAGLGQGSGVKTLQGRLHFMERVPVLKTSKRRGGVIRPQDVTYQSFEKSRLLKGVAYNKEQLIGQALKTAVSSGMPLLVSALEPPKVIQKGDLISIVFDEGNIYMKTTAAALEAGAVGELITARNLKTQKLIQARVMGQKLAKLEL